MGFIPFMPILTDTKPVVAAEKKGGESHVAVCLNLAFG